VAAYFAAPHTLKLIPIIFALVISALGPADSSATRPAATQATTQPQGFSDIVEIIVWPGGPAWGFRIFRDGGAILQYGSDPGDNASLPPGTLDFDFILESVAGQQSAQGTNGLTAVGLVRKGESATRMFWLADDTYFRNLFPWITDKWKNKGPHFDELMKTDPIYGPLPGDDERATTRSSN
jgi:hypothetical protein